MFRRLWNLLHQRPGLFFLFLLLSPVYVPVIAYEQAKRRYWGPRYQDPQFGRLLKEVDTDAFSAHVPWNGQRTCLSVPAVDNQPQLAALERARTLWADAAVWHRRATDCAIENLFDLWHSNWRSQHQRALTREEFRSCLKIESIAVEEDGSIEFWYEDGGLFWFHSVVVEMDAEDSMQRAYLAG